MELVNLKCVFFRVNVGFRGAFWKEFCRALTLERLSSVAIKLATPTIAYQTGVPQQCHREKVKRLTNSASGQGSEGTANPSITYNLLHFILSTHPLRIPSMSPHVLNMTPVCARSIHPL